jgi:site-specific DNA recombinase
MRVAIYGRVSTEEQAQEGFSIAAQKEKLTAFVQSQDWDIYDYYIDEGVSAKDTDRPELQRMLRDIRDRKIDVVLVYRLDRLTRSVLDLYQLLQEFERYDVKFKSATEVYDTTTAIGRLFITLVAALAQWERENLAERVKFGQEQMVNELKRPGGRPPYGFDLVDGTLVINEQEAPIVREIFDRYIHGTGLDSIAADLNLRGIPTKFGKEWSKVTVQNLLQNQTYYGALRWNYRKGGRKVNSPEDWVIIEGVYDPIIDKATFETAQKVMQSRRLKHPRELASDFIFSGVLHCARCGGSMYGKTTRSKHGEKVYEQRHYICKNVKEKKCNAPMIREEFLERYFLDELDTRQNELSARKAVKRQKSAPKRETDSIEKQIAKLNERRKRWQLAFAEGLIEIEEFRERVAEERQKEQELRRQLEQHANETSLTDEQILSVIRNIKLAWDYATPAEKKQLVSILVKSMAVEIDESERHKWAKNKPIKVESLSFH